MPETSKLLTSKLPWYSLLVKNLWSPYFGVTKHENSICVEPFVPFTSLLLLLHDYFLHPHITC